MSNTTDKHSTTAILEESPGQGLFELTFTNSRRRGTRPMQTHHCQGVLYASGHVHLDTRNIVVTDFVVQIYVIDVYLLLFSFRNTRGKSLLMLEFTL